MHKCQVFDHKREREREREKIKGRDIFLSIKDNKVIVSKKKSLVEGLRKFH